MNTGLIAGISAAIVLLAVLGWLAWRRRRRSSIREALAAVAVERIDNIVVPDGAGGEIHIEHLLLTTRGILVVNVKRYEGVIFASDKMDQWTAIGPAGRSTFANPLGSLYDRVAAVRLLVREVDVAGYVLFPAEADFSKGKPADIRLPADLMEEYAKPNDGDVGRIVEAFWPQWEAVRSAAEPA
jgi:Nuclease-related domain